MLRVVDLLDQDGVKFVMNLFFMVCFTPTDGQELSLVITEHLAMVPCALQLLKLKPRWCLKP